LIGAETANSGCQFDVGVSIEPYSTSFIQNLTSHLDIVIRHLYTWFETGVNDIGLVVVIEPLLFTTHCSPDDDIWKYTQSVGAVVCVCLI